MLRSIKKYLKRYSYVRHIADILRPIFRNGKFDTSEKYWKNRYRWEGNSGTGSYGKLSEFKADVINEFVEINDVENVIEYGCGDGNQLRLAKYKKYTGFDISNDALAQCRKIFRGDNTKTFKKMTEYNDDKGEVVLSLDVIYHLVEDDVFDEYMTRVFNSSTRYVIIYSSCKEDHEYSQSSHVRHRNFKEWITSNAPEWKMIEYIPNKYPGSGDTKEGSFADFYIYGNINNGIESVSDRG